MKTEQRQITFRIPADMHKALKFAVVERNTTMKDLLTDYIKSVISEDENKKKSRKQ